jgi:hypothetical protein
MRLIHTRCRRSVRVSLQNSSVDTARQRSGAGARRRGVAALHRNSALTKNLPSFWKRRERESDGFYVLDFPAFQSGVPLVASELETRDRPDDSGRFVPDPLREATMLPYVARFVVRTTFRTTSDRAPCDCLSRAIAINTRLLAAEQRRGRRSQIADRVSWWWRCCRSLCAADMSTALHFSTRVVKHSQKPFLHRVRVPLDPLQSQTLSPIRASVCC